MNETREKRIIYLKRKQNGRRLKPQLFDKINDKGYSSHLNRFVDQDDSYKLYDIYMNLTVGSKLVNLHDVKKEDVINSLSSLDKSTWSQGGYLFFRHFLEVGSFEVGLKFILSNIFELCLELDGDSIYYLDKTNKHAIYFDYSSNNIEPDNCFDLEIW